MVGVKVLLFIHQARRSGTKFLEREGQEPVGHEQLSSLRVFSEDFVHELHRWALYLN